LYQILFDITFKSDEYQLTLFEPHLYQKLLVR